MEKQKIKSKDWDNVSPNRGQRRAKKVLQYLPKEGLHLDVGAGEGDGTLVFSKIKETIGIEYNKESYEIAKQKGLNMKNGNAICLPFKTDSFDTISCLDVLEHIPDYEKAISEMVRVLKPNCKLILQTPIAEYFKERSLRFIRKYKLIKQKQPYDKPLPRNIIINELKKNGLVIEQEFPIRYWAKNKVVYFFSWSRVFICRKIDK